MALVLSSLGIFRSIGPALAIAVAVTLLAALTLVPGGRDRAGPRAVLAVQEVPRRAGGRPVRGRRAVGGPAPGPLRAGLRRRARPARARRVLLQPLLRPRRQQHLGRRGVGGGAARPSRRASRRAPPTPRPSCCARTDGEPAGRGRAHRVQAGAGRRSTVSRRSAPGQPSEDGTVASFSVYPRGRPRVRRGHRGGEGTDPRRGPRGRTGRHRGAGRRDHVGVRGLPGRDEPRLHGGLPGRRDRHHDHPGAAAAQPGRAARTSWPRSASASAPRSAPRRSVFQNIKGDAGLLFLLPIYVYLFVVALGTDYNILMIARLREEARDGLEPRRRRSRGDQARRPDHRGGRRDPGRAPSRH